MTRCSAEAQETKHHCPADYVYFSRISGMQSFSFVPCAHEFGFPGVCELLKVKIHMPQCHVDLHPQFAEKADILYSFFVSHVHLWFLAKQLVIIIKAFF